MPSDPAPLVAVHVDALEHTLRATHALASTFDEATWELPTDCPGWSVRDQVSHLIDMELRMMGEPPPVHQLPADLPYLRHDTARALECGVELRRQRSGEQVLGEFGEVIDRRISGLRELLVSGVDPAVETPFWGRLPTSRVLRVRVFDAWAHEQDIRRATKQPGNLASPAAVVTWKFMARRLPGVVEQVGLGTGTVVAFEVTGPLQIRQTVGEGEPTIIVRTDWETFVRLICGRIGPAEQPAVTTTGDPAQASRLLAGLGVTP